MRAFKLPSYRFRKYIECSSKVSLIKNYFVIIFANIISHVYRTCSPPTNVRMNKALVHEGQY